MFPSNVTRDAPKGSPIVSGWVTNKLERGSACTFCVCMAIVLMRKTGFAWSSNPYGITDPKGKPCCLRESVERLPTRPRYTKVNARSANVGSATAGWLLAAPEPACFPAACDDIPVLLNGFRTRAGIVSCSADFEQTNASRLELSI